MIEEIQAAYYMVAATGVLIAAVFYVLNMRATLQTRQAQLFMQLYNIYESKDFLKDYTDIWRYEYSDINDWMQKYHPLKNPGAYASFMRVGRFYEGVGILVEKNLISMDLVMELMREAILFNWDRLKIYAYGRARLKEFLNNSKMQHSEIPMAVASIGKPGMPPPLDCCG